MANISEKLKAELGYSPLVDSVLLQFDMEILLATPHILPLLLDDVFLTCDYVHGMRHLGGQVIRWHQHEHMVEIHHCLDGEYIFEVIGQPPLTLHAGSGVIIAPGLNHQTSCTKNGVRLTARSEIDGPRKALFTQDLVDQAAGKLISFNDQYLEIALCRLFKTLLEDRSNPWKYEIAGGLIHMWLANILATGFDFTAHSLLPAADTGHHSRGNALCKQASAFIHTHFQQPININEIAQHIGITARHLNRLFKQYVGTSINQTLRDVRLAQAFRILSRHPPPSIKETAYHIGFASPSYFTRCFKQQYGILPSEVNPRLSQPLKDALKHINLHRPTAD